jgi:hypothetical protein
MDFDDLFWEVRYRFNRLRSRSYVPSKFYAWIISSPDHALKRCLKSAMFHAHIDSAHALVKLNDDIQPRFLPASQWSPPPRTPHSPWGSQPVADQKDSLFFKLPPELRNAIYRLASAERVFHVAHTAERRMAVVECQFTPSQRDGQPLGLCCIAPQSFNRNSHSQIHFPPLLIRRSLHKTLEKTVTSRFSLSAPFSSSYYEPIFPQSNKPNVLTLAMTCRRM